MHKLNSAALPAFTLEYRGDLTTLRFCGELNNGNRRQIRSALEAATGPRIVVDLSAVTWVETPVMKEILAFVGTNRPRELAQDARAFPRPDSGKPLGQRGFRPQIKFLIARGSPPEHTFRFMGLYAVLDIHLVK